MRDLRLVLLFHLLNLVVCIEKHLEACFLAMALGTAAPARLYSHFGGDDVRLGQLMSHCLDGLRCGLSMMLKCLIERVLDHRILVLPG